MCPSPVAGHRHDRRRLRQPIVAIANSYTQFVPGHVHPKDMGALVAEQIAAAGGIGREFHAIVVDDGIAMGHSGARRWCSTASPTPRPT